MPRIYQRKHADYGKTPPDVMQRAVDDVNNGRPLRFVAKEYGIPRGTLRNNVKKAGQGVGLPFCPNYQHARVFSEEQEAELAHYAVRCAKMFYGLTTKCIRKLAYDLAKANNLKFPPRWEDEKMAGKEWYLGFMRRHQNLSIRQPEATSLARATAFNRHTVGAYFNLLESSYKELGVAGAQIFNLDETGITTVHKVPKVIGQKGVRQVGQVTSGERGELVTMCCIVSAAGQSIPPIFVFPRKNFKDIMLNGAPEGSLGLVHSSGWMTADNFVHVVKHIIKHVRPSREYPIILSMDNHESHISYATLELAKANHIRIITLPPHTSNKTQPLDRTVFGPLKAAYSRSADSWMLQNPGKTFTIYQLAQLGGDAFLKAATHTNIASGFRVSGMWPLDKDAFDSEEYLPSDVTDRQPPGEPLGQAALLGLAAPLPSSSSSDDSAPVPSQSQTELPANAVPSSAQAATPPLPPVPSAVNYVSPADLRGYPKAPPRKESSRGRKRGKSMVATSTPEMKRIREEALKKTQKTQKNPTGVSKRLTFDIDDSASDISLNELMDVTESEDEPECADVLKLGLVEHVRMRDYVLCEFAKKAHKFYYVGQVSKERDSDDDIEVEFLRRKGSYFVKPSVEDISSVHIDSVKALLPQPTVRGTTLRTKGELVFSTDFGQIDVR